MVNKQILKLSKLCEHWASHNDSHIESFQKWFEIAKGMGLNSVAENLNKAIEMMDRSTEYLIAAKNQLNL